MGQAVDQSVREKLDEKLLALEDELDSDVLTYYGAIVDRNEREFVRIVEELAREKRASDRISLLLTTDGGSATAVERYVRILRENYSEVNFLVPDHAYSAGTIFCMSGDNIYMDYYSVLGPIDPQVRNKEGKWVAALGYLDKVQEFVDKARNGNLTNAEFLILKDFDLAELREFEQARDLTISLLKDWLVRYKFKNWNTHRSDPGKVGQAVTDEEKEARAEEIASKLSDNKKWQSHSRPIHIETLEQDLRLQIEDYSAQGKRKDLIRSYHDLLMDHVQNNGFPIFVHTRKHF